MLTTILLHNINFFFWTNLEKKQISFLNKGSVKHLAVIIKRRGSFNNNGTWKQQFRLDSALRSVTSSKCPPSSSTLKLWSIKLRWGLSANGSEVIVPKADVQRQTGLAWAITTAAASTVRCHRHVIRHHLSFVPSFNDGLGLYWREVLWLLYHMGLQEDGISVCMCVFFMQLSLIRNTLVGDYGWSKKFK